MDNYRAGQQDHRSSLRDWIDPSRIYDTTRPVERWPFVWGLAIYPFLVIFLFLTVILIVMETVYPSANLPDYIGIVIWFFMLAWVAAAVAICLRRLNYLGKSQAWVWLIVLPVVSLVFFLYLLIKSAPAQTPYPG